MSVCSDIADYHWLTGIAARLRERRIGQLEIKKRGVEITHEKLRQEFRLVATTWPHC